jgi:hypothetical protein
MRAQHSLIHAFLVGIAHLVIVHLPFLATVLLFLFIILEPCCISSRSLLAHAGLVPVGAHNNLILIHPRVRVLTTKQASFFPSDLHESS